MSDLLKEAIADAKAVRETALANAKMALEEAFTPHLKSMLSAKLAEDDLEEEDPFAKDDEEEGEEDAEDMARQYREDDDEESAVDIDIDADGDDEEETKYNDTLRQKIMSGTVKICGKSCTRPPPLTHCKKAEVWLKIP